VANPGVQRRWNKLWKGIDPITITFCDDLARAKVINACYKGDARDWFVALRDAGLSTSLDADFSDPAMAAFLEERLKLGCYPGLQKKRIRHVRHIKHALKAYFLAAQPQYKLRTNSVPPVAIPIPRRWKISRGDARAMLPAADRAKLQQIDTVIRASAKKQWVGLGAAMLKGTDGRMHKATVSATQAEKLVETVDDFLRHAANSNWPNFTLAKLLTPERVTNFLYYAKRYDGGGLSPHTIQNRENNLLDFFYRGRVARPAPVVVITPKQEQAIRAAMLEEQQHKDQWNLTSPALLNTGKSKWYPVLDEVRLGILALEEQITRADEQHERGFISDERHWLDVRNATMALCALYCMWRADTVSTVSLLHLRRDPVTGSPLDADGFAVVEKIARAKNPKGDWYPFVPELVLPPNVVRLIEKLLALEGRSLAKPLREGEQPVRLSAAHGDRWGNDVILDGELTVAPLFRSNRFDPQGLGYGSVQDVLEEKLEQLQFGATNPHTFRATGAIYWTFIQEMPEDLVMTLGLWEDTRTLRENYAHIQQADRRARMARYVPVTSGVVPVKPRGRRESAAAGAITVLTKLLEKTTNPFEARRYLTELRRHCEEIDQTIAAELGLRWEAIRPDRFEPGEVERIDAALKAAGYPLGIKSVLKRDLFAADALRSRAQAVLAGPTLPKELQQLRTVLQQRALLPPLAEAPTRNTPRRRAQPVQRRSA